MNVYAQRPGASQVQVVCLCVIGASLMGIEAVGLAGGDEGGVLGDADVWLSVLIEKVMEGLAGASHFDGELERGADRLEAVATRLYAGLKSDLYRYSGRDKTLAAGRSSKSLPPLLLASLGCFLGL